MSALRFHTGEIILSTVLRLGVLALLGIGVQRGVRAGAKTIFAGFLGLA